MDETKPAGVGPVLSDQLGPLPERLRRNAGNWMPTNDNTLEAHNLLTAAADELERLRAALAESCDEHRSEIYDTATGGGCILLHDAVAAERERCASMAENYDLGTVEGHAIAAAIRGPNVADEAGQTAALK